MNLKWKMYIEYSECWWAARIVYYVEKKIKENKQNSWQEIKNK